MSKGIGHIIPTIVAEQIEDRVAQGGPAPDFDVALMADSLRLTGSGICNVL